MKQCKQCDQEFEPQRSTAVYCSAKCRVYAKRNTVSVTALPADVVAEIERLCAENNNGARAASHSRAVMTERATRYHRMFGARTQPMSVAPSPQADTMPHVVGAGCEGKE